MEFTSPGEGTDMPTLITCPSCTRQLKVPDHLLGKKVKCPTCSTTFSAAAVGAGEPVPEPPPLPDAPSASVPARTRPRDDDYDDDRDDYDDRPRRRRRRIRRDSEPHRGGLILALGIISLVPMGCSLIAPFAWYMGSKDLRKIRNGTMDPEGESMTTAGWICGIIGSVILIISVLVGCVYAIFFAVVVGTAVKAAGDLDKNVNDPNKNFGRPPGAPVRPNR
jgi:predicted Zn finger-like uncharacterized protein